MDFCEKVKEKKLKFEWSCSCRVDQVDEELLKKMKESGCWRIGFGVEAGNQKVIDWYGKKITIEKAKDAIRMCKKVGISTYCFFIMGAPMENEEMIKETIKVMKEMNPDAMGLGFLTPFPGSKLYEYALENDLIVKKNWEMFDELLPMMKSDISEGRLIELSRKAYREFYFRPYYIFSQIKEIAKNPRLAFVGLKTIIQRVTLKK